MTADRRERGRLARLRGRRAEVIAAIWLTLRGYRIIGHNVRTPMGEIDLIARRGQVVAFVEVKARTGASEVFDALRVAQRHRIIRAGEWFLARRSDLAERDRRHDVVLVRPWRLPIHMVDAWRAD